MSEFYNCHIHDCQPKFYGDAVMIRSMICPGCEKAVEENKRLREENTRLHSALKQIGNLSDYADDVDPSQVSSIVRDALGRK